VKITDIACGIFERLVSHAPRDAAEGVLIGCNEFDLNRFEKWHRKKAGQFHTLFAESDEGGEGFDEVLAPVAVVECAGAEEECHRRINRRFFASIPDDAQARAAKGNRSLARDRESQFSYCGRGMGQCEQDFGFVRANTSKRTVGFRGVGW